MRAAGNPSIPLLLCEGARRIVVGPHSSAVFTPGTNEIGFRLLNPLPSAGLEPTSGVDRRWPSVRSDPGISFVIAAIISEKSGRKTGEIEDEKDA